MEYCFNCHRYANCHISELKTEGIIYKIYFCKNCGAWIKTITEPIRKP